MSGQESCGHSGECQEKKSVYDRVIARDISTINSKINNMDEKTLRRKFGWFKFEESNEIELYRKAVKQKFASIIMSNCDVLYKNGQTLAHYVVIDFEATCEAVNAPNYRHEIIEFPAILVNGTTLEIVDTFRRIVRPTVKPKLSEFCTQLTDITQAEVDAADSFPVVMDEFHSWLESHQLTEFSVVTDGPWDTCRFLYVQCAISGIPYPKWAEQWLDLRRVFGKFYNEKRCSLSKMLDIVGMSFEGRPHCGIDDAHNIARLVIRLACDGAPLLPNQSLTRASRARHTGQPDMCELINLLSLEGENYVLENKSKCLTHRDVKIERSRRIHALTKHIQLDEECTDSDQLAEVNLDKIMQRSSKPQSHSTKRKNKKKRFK